MKNKECLSRYVLIIRIIQRNQKATIKDIQRGLKEASNCFDVDFNVSKRTLERDMIAISDIFRMNISYSYSDRSYSIDEESFDPKYTEKLIEHLEVFHSLKMLDNIKEIFHFDNKKPLGTQHLSQMIAAIKNRQIIYLIYNKDWENQKTEFELLPLLLKEYKGRWYVLAKRLSDGKIRTYSLDRVVSFSLLNKHDTPPEGVAHYFDNSFGIFSKDGQQPEEVVLRFTKEAGKFVKEATLHSSQEIISYTEKEISIRLHLLVTLDFIMELLSYGESVEVISPQHLRNKIRERLQKATDLYK
ncbi:MAG: WYL domain-containing protein [Bacteroidales bacterium]|nr:WYL domain-containing protein [Bacteroidales bacterium]